MVRFPSSRISSMKSGYGVASNLFGRCRREAKREIKERKRTNFAFRRQSLRDFFGTDQRFRFGGTLKAGLPPVAG